MDPCGLGDKNGTRPQRKVEYFNENGYLVKEFGVGIPSEGTRVRLGRRGWLGIIRSRLKVVRVLLLPGKCEFDACGCAPNTQAAAPGCATASRIAESRAARATQSTMRAAFTAARTESSDVSLCPRLQVCRVLCVSGFDKELGPARD